VETPNEQPLMAQVPGAQQDIAIPERQQLIGQPAVADETGEMTTPRRTMMTRAEAERRIAWTITWSG
jgi:hypothetical protein